MKYILTVIASLALSTSAFARAQPHPAGGVSIGLAYAPDARFEKVSWTFSPAVEHLIGNSLEIRGVFGLANLRSDTTRNGTYGFVAADFLTADLVSPVLGVGVYR